MINLSEDIIKNNPIREEYSLQSILQAILKNIVLHCYVQPVSTNVACQWTRNNNFSENNCENAARATVNYLKSLYKCILNNVSYQRVTIYIFAFSVTTSSSVSSSSTPSSSSVSTVTTIR